MYIFKATIHAKIASFSSILGLVLTTQVTWAVPVKKLQPKPKLVLMLVIDQFRADYLTRFHGRFLAAKDKNGKIGGFEYLISHGAYFPFSQYDILQCMTGPGHATVLTGAYPYQAGIPSNDWYDREAHDRMYCTEDRSQPTVGAAPSDPHVGTSPKNLIATTVGDELKNAGYPSRVVSIAIKDRSAILMGGHRADLVLWMDKKSFQWVSSRFYLPNGKLPDWVAKLNSSLLNEKGQISEWKTEGNGSGLSLNKARIPAEWNPENWKVTFPHSAKKGSEGSLSMPFGLEITEDLVEKAIDEYQLGKGNATDLLAVSFSSHDYLGHDFGPNSREMEEMTLADDKTISKLLNYLKHQVPGGLENVVVVLTADHGVPPAPDWLKENRIVAGRINEKDLVSKVESLLADKFGRPKHGSYIAYNESLNFYLDDRALKEQKLTKKEVEEKVKEVVREEPGIAYVFTSSEYDKRLLPPGMHERQILHTYFQGRSGDIIAIPKPYFFSDGSTVTHMTGYSYDRTVPIIFTGTGIHSGTFSNLGQVIDIAPTLSYILGTVAPSLSEGRVLSEIFVQ